MRTLGTHHRLLARTLGVSAVATVLAGGAAATAHAAGPSFAKPVQLQGGCGGEPSIDTDGLGHVYVSSPRGILAYTASCLNGGAPATATGGVSTWWSGDHGQSFSDMIGAGTANGGGDSDTTVDPQTGDVYLADLEAVGSDICVSHDHGATWNPFPNPTGQETCTAGSTPNFTAGNQSGFEADRQWIDVYGPTATYSHKDVYLIYHDFAVGVPLVWRSQDGGPFQPLAAPAMTDPAFAQQVANGTVMAKPVVDSSGNIYALVTTAGPAQGSLNHLWLIRSSDHGQTWSDTSIFAGVSSAQLGLVFNDLAIDGAGNLYALTLGNAGGAVPPVHAYLLTSTDRGATWRQADISPAGNPALALPALHGGPQAGDLAIGWYQSTNTTDPNDVNGHWQYVALESSDATAAAPAFVTAKLGSPRTPGPGAVHDGQICTQGILCTTGQLEDSVSPATGTGAGSGNRNLADFSSVTIDSNGCAIYVYADDGDQSGDFLLKTTSNDVTRQLSGCFATGPPANTPEAPATLILLATGALAGGGALLLRRRGARQRSVR